MDKSASGVRQEITAPRRKKQRRRFPHDTPHRQKDTLHDTRHGRRQQDRADHMPLGSSHADGAAPVTLRHRPQRLLRIARDQRQYHQSQRQRPGQDRIAHSQRGAEKHHPEQSENNGGNARQRLRRKLNKPHPSARRRILVQPDRRPHSCRHSHHKRQHYDIYRIHQIPCDADSPLHHTGHRRKKRKPENRNPFRKNIKDYSGQQQHRIKGRKIDESKRDGVFYFSRHGIPLLSTRRFPFP